MGLLRMTRRERDEAYVRARTVYVAELARIQADVRRHEAIPDEAERDLAAEDDRIEAERPVVAQNEPRGASSADARTARLASNDRSFRAARWLQEAGRRLNERREAEKRTRREEAEGLPRKRVAWDQERARIMEHFRTEQRELEAAHHEALEQLEERRESALRAQGLRP